MFSILASSQTILQIAMLLVTLGAWFDHDVYQYIGGLFLISNYFLANIWQYHCKNYVLKNKLSLISKFFHNLRAPNAKNACRKLNAKSLGLYAHLPIYKMEIITSFATIVTGTIIGFIIGRGAFLPLFLVILFCVFYLLPKYTKIYTWHDFRYYRICDRMRVTFELIVRYKQHLDVTAPDTQAFFPDLIKRYETYQRICAKLLKTEVAMDMIGHLFFPIGVILFSVCRSHWEFHESDAYMTMFLTVLAFMQAPISDLPDILSDYIKAKIASSHLSPHFKSILPREKNFNHESAAPIPLHAGTSPGWFNPSFQTLDWYSSGELAKYKIAAVTKNEDLEVDLNDSQLFIDSAKPSQPTLAGSLVHKRRGIPFYQLKSLAKPVASLLITNALSACSVFLPYYVITRNIVYEQHQSLLIAATIPLIVICFYIRSTAMIRSAKKIWVINFRFFSSYMRSGHSTHDPHLPKHLDDLVVFNERFHWFVNNSSMHLFSAMLSLGSLAAINYQVFITTCFGIGAMITLSLFRTNSLSSFYQSFRHSQSQVNRILTHLFYDFSFVQHASKRLNLQQKVEKCLQQEAVFDKKISLEKTRSYAFFLVIWLFSMAFVNHQFHLTDGLAYFLSLRSCFCLFRFARSLMNVRMQWPKYWQSTPKDGLKTIHQLTTIRIHRMSQHLNRRKLYNNLNLNLRTPQSLRVTGKNGTGKTTLFRILCKANAIPYTGTVWINGTDIKNIRKSSLLNRVTYVGQNPAPLSKNEWFQILETTNHSYLKNLHPCFSELSHKPFENAPPLHQRQLMQAGAIFTRSSKDIYIIDEGFSALGKSVEAQLLKILRRLFSDSILLICSHQDLCDFEFDEEIRL